MLNPNPTAFESGRVEALKDIEAGTCRFFWGIRRPWGQYLSDIMRSRFGVQVVETSCFVWDELTSFRNAYNAEIEAHIDRKFGPGSVKQALQETDEYRQQLYKKWLASKGDA